jgi:predicted ArsR family transcriptional regulator
LDIYEAIGDSGLREALLFARSARAPVTADELAAASGSHRNTARSRLERLAAAGLLTPSFERRTGRTGPGAGRPAKVYAVAPQPASVELPARRYELLVALLAAELPRRARAARVRAAGLGFGSELARAGGVRAAKGLRRGLERVCAAVRGLGFHAVVDAADDTSGAIVTTTCPLRAVVLSSPDAAELDRAMWSALVASAVDGVDISDVACDTRDCLGGGACRVLVSVAPHSR